MRGPRRLLLLFPLLGLFPSPLAAQAPPTPCHERPAYRALDFWVGEWDVKGLDGQLYGTNRIEKILNGCALLEHWTSARGGQGKSLFYFDLATENWKQVWVTGSGTMKEKALVKEFSGGVRFQGEVTRLDGRTVLDRTTLTPEGTGRVRQKIAVSTDGGRTWRTVFDALYVRREQR